MASHLRIIARAAQASQSHGTRRRRATGAFARAVSLFGAFARAVSQIAAHDATKHRRQRRLARAPSVSEKYWSTSVSEIALGAMRSSYSDQCFLSEQPQIIAPVTPAIAIACTNESMPSERWKKSR